MVQEPFDTTVVVPLLVSEVVTPEEAFEYKVTVPPISLEVPDTVEILPELVQ